jgi:hypothetical protein
VRLQSLPTDSRCEPTVTCTARLGERRGRRRKWHAGATSSPRAASHHSPHAHAAPAPACGGRTSASLGAARVPLDGGGAGTTKRNRRARARRRGVLARPRRGDVGVRRCLGLTGVPSVWGRTYPQTARRERDNSRLKTRKCCVYNVRRARPQTRAASGTRLAGGVSDGNTFATRISRAAPLTR